MAPTVVSLDGAVNTRHVPYYTHLAYCFTTISQLSIGFQTSIQHSFSPSDCREPVLWSGDMVMTIPSCQLLSRNGFYLRYLKLHSASNPVYSLELLGPLQVFCHGQVEHTQSSAPGVADASAPDIVRPSMQGIRPFRLSSTLQKDLSFATTKHSYRRSSSRYIFDCRIAPHDINLSASWPNRSPPSLR